MWTYIFIRTPFLQVPGGMTANSVTVGTVADGIERYCGRVWTINVIGSGTIATRSVCSKFHLLEAEIQIWNGF